MATVPLSGTNIRLLSGIPFSSDYKHTRWFDNYSDQINWFAAQTRVADISQANFQRIEGYNYIAVNMSIDQLWGTNYLYFMNGNYSNKWFYAFVTKLEYKQHNTTYVHFEIDVLQTWMWDYNFKPSFVVREHQTLWNADGSPVINTIDEGLHYGTEYDTVYTQQFMPTNGWKWLVIVAKNAIHVGAPTDSSGKYTVVPTVVGTPQTLTTYILPFRDNNTVPGLVDTAGSGIVLSKPTDVMNFLYKDSTAVNNIVSMYITDFTGIKMSVASGNPDTITLDGSTGNVVTGVQIKDPNNTSNFMNCLYVQNVSSFVSVDTLIEAKYANYKSVTESKLMMYPYTVLTLDDFKGNRVSFKNEYINNFNLYITAKGSLGTSNKTSYGIVDYNFNDQDTSSRSYVSDESALINNEANDIPIVTDLLSAYLQGNKNSLQNQKNQILFDTSAGVLSSAVNLVSSAFMGATSGMANSMGMYGPSGAAPGAIGGAAIGATQSLISATKGAADGAFAMQALQAKQQDIANIPPSINKMGSNTSYTIGNGYNGLFIIKKQIKDEYIKKLQDYFNMFGYKKNEVKIPNFHTRQNWNYVQTQNCTITGNINNEDLQELKNIFDGGITLWHTDDIGNYTLANGVL